MKHITIAIKFELYSIRFSVKTTSGNAPAPNIGPTMFKAVPATIPRIMPKQTQIKLVNVCFTFKPWVKKATQPINIAQIGNCKAALVAAAVAAMVAAIAE